MKQITQQEVQLSPADLKEAIFEWLQKADHSGGVGLPVDPASLIVASNINLEPHVSVKWTRCTGAS